MHELFHVDMWHNWILGDRFMQLYVVRQGPGVTAWRARAWAKRQRELQAWLAMNPNATVDPWPGLPNERYC